MLGMQEKIRRPEELQAWRASVGKGPVAVLCGSFDLMQPGNLQSVQWAARHADHVLVLIATGTSDPGDVRPLLTEDERVAMVSYLRSVSAVCCLTPDHAANAADVLGVYTWVGNPEADADEPLAALIRPAAAGYVDTTRIANSRTSEILGAIRGLTTPIATPGDATRGDPAAEPPKEERVTVNGCFDILHPGHMAFLADARSMGSHLVVMINSDASVRRYKGPTRPIYPEAFRSTMLRELSAVDNVFVFDDDTPLALLAELQPAVHVKGGSFEAGRVADEQQQLDSWGGRLAYSPMVAQFSTTRYLERIQEVTGD